MTVEGDDEGSSGPLMGLVEPEGSAVPQGPPVVERRHLPGAPLNIVVLE